MNIYEELKKDHQKVLALLDRLIASEHEGPEVRGRLVDQIRDDLVPHARAEEAILYNALRDQDQSKDVVMHAYGEHAEVEAVLRSLQVTGAVNVNWAAGARKLRELLVHHIAEEEGKVFAAAQRYFSEEEATLMREAFVQMKPQVKGESVVGTTLDMIANLLPARLRASVRKGGPTQNYLSF